MKSSAPVSNPKTTLKTLAVVTDGMAANTEQGSVQLTRSTLLPRRWIPPLDGPQSLPPPQHHLPPPVPLHSRVTPPSGSFPDLVVALDLHFSARKTGRGF